MTVAMLLVTSSAWAQTAAPEKVPAEQQRQAEGIRGAADAAQSSFESGLTGGPEVTYEQVLANPDDPGLNAAWARSQIAHGDLLGASATLERLLLVHPEIIEARLVHGLVLYRLDDLLTAKAELSGIDPQTLTAAQQDELRRILGQIEQRSKRLRQTVTLAMGSHFDTNRNASPSSGVILISDTPFTLEGSARKKKDWGNLEMAGYEADYDLGTDPKMSVFGGLNLLSDKQATVNSQDVALGGSTVGLRYQSGPLGLQIAGFWNNMTLESDYYMNDWGLAGRATYRLAPTWEAFADLRLDDQTFHNVTADTLGSNNSGTLPSLWLGSQWHVTPAHTLTMALGAAQRDAQAKFMSNDRWALRLGETWLLGQGQFINATSEFGLAIYDRPDTTFSAMTRRDRDARFALTYGVPVGTMAGAVGLDAPEDLRDVVFSLSGEYYRAVSSLTNYTYSNIRTQALVSKRWEF